MSYLREVILRIYRYVLRLKILRNDTYNVLIDFLNIHVHCNKKEVNAAASR